MKSINLWYCLLLLVGQDVISIDAVSSVRLSGGTAHYGFVELNINGVWKPVCPGPHFSVKQIPEAICMEMEFVSGRQFQMDKSLSSPSWWHNTFEQEDFRATILPKMDAYVTNNWISVDGTGEFSYCTTLTLAVLCVGNVSIERADHYSLYNVKEPGFGYVVVTESYLDSAGINDVDTQVICSELGYNASKKIDNGLTIGFTGFYNKIAKNYHCTGTERSLSDCPATNMATGQSHRPATISCSFDSDNTPDFTVRINKDKLVEIRYQKTWGLICGDSFTDVDSSVVCKSLGFTGAVASKIPVNNLDMVYALWINSLNCVADKNSPKDCAKVLNNGQQCSTVASVRCFDAQKEGVYKIFPSTRLVLGNHFVERDSNGQKGVLVINSEKGSDDREGSMICRILGRSSGFNYQLPAPGMEPSDTMYWVATYANNGATCSSIDGCFEDDWTHLDSGNALDKDKVKITVCHDTVYLEGNGYSGIVRYVINPSEFAAVNDASLTQDEANLICKELGFTNGGRKIDPSLYRANSPRDIYNIACVAGATNIKDNCTFTRVNDMTNIQKAAIECTLAGDLSVTSMGSFIDSKGIVHINKDGIPGRICTDSSPWGDLQATVLCRELGFDVAIPFIERHHNDNGYPPVTFKSVVCQGNEDALRECTFTPLGAGDSSCSKVGAVTCYDKADKIQFKLVDGGYRYGRVKITKAGKEGYFCPNKFDEEDAATVCRELGFENGDEWPMEPVTASSTSWWTVSTNCGHDTQVIEACEGQNWAYTTPSVASSSDCSWKTAAVDCYSKDHLESAPYLAYGAVRQSNTKLRFSSKSFGSTEAMVGCKEMGFLQGGRVFPSTPYKKSKKLPLAIKCIGTEKSLSECAKTTELTDKKLFASIACETGEDIPANGTLKIAVDMRVLIVKYGVWGAICGKDWTDSEASVVCKQLTGSGGKAVVRGRKSTPEYANFLDAWTCTGTEAHLSDCPIDGTKKETYCYNSAAVYCDNHKITAVEHVSYPAPPNGVDPLTTTMTIHPPASTNPTTTSDSSSITGKSSGKSASNKSLKTGKSSTDSGGNNNTGVAVWILLSMLVINKLWL